MLLHVQSASQPRLNRSSVNAGPEKVFLWSSRSRSARGRRGGGRRRFAFVCLRMCVFDFVWRTLQIASEKPHQNTASTCPQRRVFFFASFFPPSTSPFWFRASRYKLPLWEPAFPALPHAGCARPEGFGDEGEPWAWFQSVPGLSFVHSEW